MSLPDNKQQIYTFLKTLNQLITAKSNFKQLINKYFSEDVHWEVSKPFRPLNGQESLFDEFWQPLCHAFPDFEMQPYILMDGTYQGRQIVSVTGNIIGTFQNDYCGIPANRQAAWLRFGMILFIENTKIARGYCFLDLLDLMHQTGFNLFKSRGASVITQGPMTQDGLLTGEKKQEGTESLRLANDMLSALGKYDGKSLASMGNLADYWNEKNMMWYGPAGIGTTRGLKGFQKYHQVPFLRAFPIRGMKPKDNDIHFVQLGDANYACDFGWPLMYATHLGDDWLGLKSSQREISLRVVDWWRIENGLLKENWVMIDMIDILEQLRVDVFQLLKQAC